MKLFITIQNKSVPVYSDEKNKKKFNLLISALDSKLVKGKRAIKKCLDSLISIEIVGCEAILHSYNETDSLALSLY
ncbi:MULTISPECIES: 3-dehydroquinate dehydratase [Paenibacillus]|uniref:3-dehydroquinate dehydratase n=1 Tax=Paenibacillus radicis (ex Xue et al. 2023) TaxID=2972489 RepID=A0ABT1YPK8_9BACL|nr:3-dehydroquinate dehydratase [Paenibacillus radicis (ex Xue et al. 2023)]MCR8635116.1 3-dehydroquinate dehydratase [Paenibacillus radicis (ex Xue et al. 2023)]